ncbi:MAG: phosphatase PAP2 family protein, partial [Anaerolineae bacterium]|nr:phosphatase PAP2 family protein [Gemmatimonadaceae bacterium]
WSSPVHADSRDWLGAAMAAGAVVATAPLDNDVDSWIVKHPNSAILRALEPVRERESGIKLYDLGSAKLIHPIVGVMYAAGFAADSRNLRDAAMGCMAAQQANGLIRQAIYKTVTRPRPFLDNADPYDIKFEHGEWPERSFFGGHAANIVACTSFFNERFDLGVAEPLLYTFAIAASVGRMADRRHWTSDTVLGIIFGHAIGHNIGRRSRERAAAKEPKGANSSGSRNQEPGTQEGSHSAKHKRNDVFALSTLPRGFFLSPSELGGVRVGWGRRF